MNYRPFIFKSLIVTISTIAVYFFLFNFNNGFSGVEKVNAETAEELQNSLNSLSDQIKALDKEIAEYNSKIGKTQGEAKTLKDALASLESRRAVLVKEIKRTQLRIEETQKNIQETTGQIVLTQNKLTEDRDSLTETVKLIQYQDTQISPFLSVFISPQSRISDVIDGLKKSQDLSKAIHNKVLVLRETQESLSNQKTVYENSKKTLESLASELSGQQSLIEQTAKDKNNLLIQTKNKESEYQKLLAERKKKKGELEAEVLDVESKIKTVVDASKIPTSAKNVLFYPLENPKITQYFGNTEFSTKNPQVYNGSGHNGIDFGIKVGTPILAAQSGTVLGIGDTDVACNAVSYGKWVLIKHENGLTTLYAHLSVIQVSAGQKVNAKEKIGLSGNTGYSTGPHLHFTVYASDSVHISGPTEYKSKVCGTYLIMPLAPREGYLNPLSFL